MRYIVTINQKNYEVEVEKGQANIVKTTQAAAVAVQESVQSVTAPGRPVAASEQADQAYAVSGEPLKAPMPGSIMAVNVHQGTSVKKGDVLFILEAMKMETEIAAPRDGVVYQVIVVVGASVSTGDILLTLQ